MSRKIGFLGIIFIFIATLSGFYIYLKRQQSTAESPFKAIPVNAALIINIPKPIKLADDLSKNNKFASEFFELNGLGKLREKLVFIDSLFHLQDLSSSLFKKEGLLVSYHELGQKTFKPVFYVMTSGRFEGNQLIKKIESLLINKGTITHARYNQVRVYTFKSNIDKKLTLHYGFHRGILLISPSDILIQDAIRQSESDIGLNEEKSLAELRETAGNHSDANIYIQFHEFRKIFGKAFNLKHVSNVGINDYSEWGTLDLNLKNTTLLFNGYSKSLDKTSRVTKVFKNQTPQNIKFVKYIPNIPEAFTIIGISDAKLFRQNLADYMEDIGQKERFDVNEQSIRDAFGNQAVNELEELIKNELAMLTLANGASLFAAETKGYRDSKEFIESILKNYCKNNSKNFKSYCKQYKIDKDTEFPIYTLPLNKLPTRLFGPWFNKCEAKYVGIFDNYIIFSSNYENLTRFIYNNVLQKTISYNSAYQKFENFLSGKVNFYQFVNLSGTGKFLEQWLTPNSYQYVNNNKEDLKEFYGAAFQFSTDDNYIYNSLLFRHQPSSNLSASTEWESKLDTMTRFKPTLVRNHYTGEKEIFIQDESNNIYLINKAGRILWKHRFEETIIGPVQQVDYFKNGKLQLIFNTKNKIHLLDRNGNYVERYPIKLKEEASAPLAIFDYENNKKYRIFIPCKNKKIYCYNIQGSIVSGFNFSGTDFEITKPLQYFRNNKKDYLVVVDQNRTYILNRKGAERVQLTKQFIPAQNSYYKLQKANSKHKARLIISDNTGKIKFVYFNGKVEELVIDEFNTDHYFKAQDITGNNQSEYIYLNNKKLIVYNHAGKKLFDHKFSTKITNEPAFYKFSATRIAIGITESEANNIYLFDYKGNTYEGFPLKGHTPFSIGTLSNKSNRFNLMVGGDDFYLYNYKLN